MSNKGFTLVEVMVVILLLSLIIASLGGLLASGVEAFNYMNNKIELQQNLRYALANIIEEIKNARELIAISDQEITLLNRKDELVTYKLARDPQAKEHLYDISGRNLYLYTEKAKQPIANFIEKISFKAEPGYQRVQDVTYITVSVQGKTSSGKRIRLNSGAELKWKSFGPLVEKD